MDHISQKYHNFNPVPKHQALEKLLLVKFTVVHSIEERKDAISYNKFVGYYMS